MLPRLHLRETAIGLLLMGLAFLPAAAEQGPPAEAAAASSQRHFSTAEEAVEALLDVLGNPGDEGLLEVLGPAVAELESGDEVEKRQTRQRFLDAAARALDLEVAGSDLVVVTLGADHWPFPIPIVREAGGWRFDTQAGLEELLNRRIGRNELHTLSVLRAIVEAQHDYARMAAAGPGREYAQRFASSEGGRDGLYWPAAAGEQESPLGPLVAAAVQEGYGRAQNAGPQPYHGYLFRLLTAQGSHAPGGAMSYLVDGRLTKGFGVLAYPADYGHSGVMSFITNQRGILFQKDLGAETAELAAALSAYDPGPGWEPVGTP